jgi:pimeloyl-ACP methyl ester carboxylesterase
MPVVPPLGCSRRRFNHDAELPGQRYTRSRRTGAPAIGRAAQLQRYVQRNDAMLCLVAVDRQRTFNQDRLVASSVRWRFVAVTVAIGVLGLAIAYVAAMVLFQRRFLFPRPPVAGAPERPKDALEVWLSTSAGRTEAWYLPPVDGMARPAPAVIFFHGNGELIDFLPTDFAEPREWGMGVLLVEFPGYGRSGGAPSERSLTEVVLAAHDWTQAQPMIDPQRIIAYGRSLGGGAAAILAGKRPIVRLLLESTFTSVRSFAHGFWLPEFVVLDPFDTLGVLSVYGGPVLVLHGKYDQVVPVRHAEELARAARHSELELVACGHNDCPSAWSRIRRFLLARGLIAA